MLVYYESAVQGKGAWGGGSLSGSKQEWTCSCISTATLIIKTEISCIATYKSMKLNIT